MGASGSGCTSAEVSAPLSGTVGTTVPSVVAGGCSEEESAGCSVVGGVVVSGSLLVAGGVVVSGVEEAGGVVVSGVDEDDVSLLEAVPLTGLPV